MGHFGPRKIGQAAFEKQAKVNEPSRYGPRKGGGEPAVDTATAIAETEAKAAAEKEPVSYTTLAQLEEALEENPSLYEEFYALEMKRADGARKGAIRLFLEQEIRHADGPRESRLNELESLL